MQENSQILDLSKLECPMNFVRAKLALEKTKSGITLELIIKNDAETFENFSSSLISEGYNFFELKETKNTIHLFIKT